MKNSGLEVYVVAVYGVSIIKIILAHYHSNSNVFLFIGIFNG